ncbi:hypothetical protein, partial [Falsiphaeobacter marinintestinus]|uniref:hypothetical protein n=1 Tax=Falsiphaeobacter marinintestinus TaxID=1492905 RepID=UPI001C974EA1
MNRNPKTQRQNQPEAPNLSGATRFSYLNVFSASFASVPASVAVPSAPSRVPLCASAPPVKWVLRFNPNTRKRFLQETT